MQAAFEIHLQSIHNLVNLFKKFDSDEDAVIDEHQYKNMISCLPIMPNDQLYSVLDIYNNNQVNVSSCIEFFGKYVPDGRTETLLEIIREIKIE